MEGVAHVPISDFAVSRSIGLNLEIPIPQPKVCDSSSHLRAATIGGRRSLFADSEGLACFPQNRGYLWRCGRPQGKRLCGAGVEWVDPYFQS